MSEPRTLAASTGKVRTQKWDGREHLVVPVVALMEGVIHAVNAETPERVTMETLKRAATSWNGKPVVLGHPTEAGRQISAGTPGVAEKQAFGTIFNSRMFGSKLLMDVFVDPARAERVGGAKFLERIKSGEPPIEVSVGAFVTTDPTPGLLNGKQYQATWLETIGDHLAFLPASRGACSIDMGCGTHRAAGDVEGHPFYGNQYSEGGGGGVPPLPPQYGAEKSPDYPAVWARVAAHDDPAKMAGEVRKMQKEADAGTLKISDGALKYAADTRKEQIRADRVNKGYGPQRSTVDARLDRLSSTRDSTGRRTARKLEGSLIPSLLSLITDLYTLYATAHAAHWNVEGPLFAEMHAFFGDLYEAAFDEVDPLAEAIRQHGAYVTPALLQNVAAPEMAINDPAALVAALDVLNKKTLAAFAAALELVGDDQGLANLLQDGMQRHKKYEWQLEAQMKNAEGKKPVVLEGKKPSLLDKLKALIASANEPFTAAADADTTAELVGYAALRELLDQASSSLDAAMTVLGDLVAGEQEAAPDEAVEEARLESLRSMCLAMMGTLSGALGAVNGMLCKGDDPMRTMAGARNSAADLKVIQGVHDHSVKLGAVCDAGNIKALEVNTDAAHTDGGKEDNMKVEEKAAIIKALTECPCSGFVAGDEKALEAFSDERLTALRAAGVERKQQQDAALKAAGEAKKPAPAPTVEDYLKNAPEEIRTLVADKKAQDAAQKADLVATLKAAQSEYTEDELKAMDVKALSRLVKVAKVDYSGQSFPRTAAENDVYANPPDPYAAGIAKLRGEKVN